MDAVDPYVGKKVSPSAFADRVTVSASAVGILRGRVLDRDLSLIPQPSRAVRKGDVHEIVVTDQAVSPGSKVARVAYLAFIEFQCGGVLLSGDKVSAGDAVVGEIAGFDLSHFPNHMNIVIRGDLSSGEERGLRLGDCVEFQMVRPDST